MTLTLSDDGRIYLSSLLDTSNTESDRHMLPVLRNRLKQHRLVRNMTQQELATVTEVSRQSIISIEKGKYVPSLPLALRLAKVFACSVEDLFRLHD